MMKKYFLGSIAALLGWTGLAQAQPLGTPITSESHFEAVYASYPSTTNASDCQGNCKPKPTHPVLNHIARAMLMPIRAATGQLMPPAPSEAPPTKEAIARMIVDGSYAPAEITAAKIKIDESQAAARRAAVRYLGTVDCNYYPEAEAGLIAALRADRIEMVRYEAAVALGSCRGLSEKMLEALNMTALGVELDGNPAESSERVRGAAQNALQRCSSRGLCFAPTTPQVMPTADWFIPDPNVLQPTSYTVPASVPFWPQTNPLELVRAETISTPPKNAPTAIAPRGLYQFFLNVTTGRETTRSHRISVDARLQGLAPLGSDLLLAIPTSPPLRDTIVPTTPYNYQE